MASSSSLMSESSLSFSWALSMECLAETERKLSKLAKSSESELLLLEENSSAGLESSELFLVEKMEGLKGFFLNFLLSVFLTF